MEAQVSLRTLGVACGLLCLSACSLFRTAKEPEGVRVVLAGDRVYLRSEALDIVRADLERFAQQRGSKSDIDDAAFALEQDLRARGCAEATVSYEYHPNEQPPRAVFRIAAKDRLRLVEVRAEGASTLSVTKLRSFFGLQSGLLGATEVPYVEEELEAARESIEAHLRGQGHLDARVELVGKERKLQDITLLLRITAGPVYRIGTIEVLEAEQLPFDSEAIRAALQPFENTVATPRSAVVVQAAIEELAASAGWPDAQASVVQRTQQDARVSYQLRLVPGPKVTVGTIHVAGHIATRESFVRSRIQLTPGTPWSRTQELDSSSDLWRSGLFSTVSVKGVEERAHTDQTGTLGVMRDVSVELNEIPSLEWSLEPLWGSYEGPMLRAGVSERNLFGTGRTLSLQAHASPKAWSTRLALHDPWSFGPEIDGEVAIYTERRQEPSFERGEIGIGLTFTKRFGPLWSGWVGWDARASKLFSSDINADPDALDGADDLDIAEFLVGASRDSRDNVYAPSEGSLTRAVLHWSDRALLSEIDWVRADFVRNDAWPLSDRLVLASSFRAGAILPYGPDDSVPLQERYFAGGENTVRSYRESQLGPKDSQGDPLGGQGWSMASVEARWKATGRFELALFVDAGNVTPEIEDWYRFEGMGYGVGAGLRYMLPVGPVRLDGAINPDPGPLDSDGALHLTVGLSF